MTEPRIGQAALFAISADNAAPSDVSQAAAFILADTPPADIQISQAALFLLSGPPLAPVQISQTAMFILLSNARGIVTLRNPIPLDCWQPCTSYGTFSQILIMGT